MILAPRHLPRIASTIGLFTRYGLIDFARQQGLQSLPQDQADHDGAAQPSRETAAAFRARLVELGPAYIKLGQVLSTRPDLLPPAYIEELEKLQNDVEPVPLSAIVPTIEEELGARLSKLFATFEETPLGTASLGQVHAAQLRDGRAVVVKVQRPDIRGPLAEDLAFFRELAGFLSTHTAAGARVDLVGIIQQMELALADELDYRIEARNTAHFRRALAQFPRLLVPRVIERYSTERVLTTERIRGIKLAGIPPVTRTETDFRPLASDLTRAYLKQITIDGHFHADPHPGNMFVVLASADNPPTPAEAAAEEPEDLAGSAPSPLTRIELEARREAPPAGRGVDVHLALIDFGMTARLSLSTRELCVRLLLALADDRGDEVAQTLIELGDPLPDFDRPNFTREIAGLVARSYDLDIEELQAGRTLYALISASFQRGLRLPAELTLLAKALVSLDTVTRTLDPAFEPMSTIREFLNHIVSDRVRRQLNPRRLYRLATETADFVGALPHRLDLITQRLANNDFAARIDVPQVTVVLNGLQKVANRVFSGLVLAGLLIASGMLLPYRPSLGTGGFVIAGVLALYMVLSILWSDRKGQ